MTIRPIRSDADYEASLGRLENLMNAEAGTPEGDELEILATLIKRYEDQRFPIEAPTPLGAIRFRMDQAGLSPKDLEPFIGSRARVSEVLSGARPLSIDMIRALHQHLGIPADVLIQSDPVVQSSEKVELSKPAAKMLIDRGLMAANENFQSFIQRACGKAPALALLRKTRTERTNAKTDLAALQAWCGGALLLAEGKTVAVKFARDLKLEDVRELANLSVFSDGPRRAIAWLAQRGIVLVVLPHLPGTHLDGAAMLRADGVPVIALTLRRDRIDLFWFTLLHELAHVNFHLSAETEAIFDDLEIGSSAEIEKEADQLAQDALIPSDLWETFDSGAYASIASVENFAQRAGVHPSIVAGRWQKLHRDFRRFSRLLGNREVRQQFPEYF